MFTDEKLNEVEARHQLRWYGHHNEGEAHVRIGPFSSKEEAEAQCPPPFTVEPYRSLPTTKLVLELVAEIRRLKSLSA